MTAEVGKQSLANFLGDTLAFARVSGRTMGLISVVVYANFFLFQDRAETYGHTAALSSIILMGLFAVYRVAQPERTQPKGSLQRLGVWTVLAGAGLLHALAIYWPPSRDFLGLTALDADSWTTRVAASLAGNGDHELVVTVDSPQAMARCVMSAARLPALAQLLARLLEARREGCWLPVLAGY